MAKKGKGVRKDSDLQAPSAGPSRERPRTPEVAALPPGRSSNGIGVMRSRDPTRTDTICEEVELGVYLRPENAGPRAGSSSTRSIEGSARPGLATSGPAPGPPTGFFLTNSIWRVDIITFCSHARIDPVLGEARITQIQARKSHRPPFLHEYLLVFFKAARNQRFVVRIDRLGKVASGSSIRGGIKPKGATGNAAIQEVGVYHVKDGDGLGGDDKPWLAADGMWGSQPVATLATWESVGTSGQQVSHHIQTAGVGISECPKLIDVARLLEAILLEMPTYNLTTTNCYLMTRSSLLLLLRCHPRAFACYIGTVSTSPIPSTFLIEPVWAGVLRWYLPFMAIFFLLYITILILSYSFLRDFTSSCDGPRDPYDSTSPCYSTLAKFDRATWNGIHAVLDVPLPVGIVHAYMTSLELEMNKVVVNVSALFLERGVDIDAAVEPSAGRAGEEQRRPPAPPFGVLFDGAWMTLTAWCLVGFGAAIFVFFSTAFEYGLLVMFSVMLVLGIWFNYKFNDSEAGVSIGQDELDELFGPSKGEVVPLPTRTKDQGLV